jgi:hypothetical protein
MIDGGQWLFGSARLPRLVRNFEPSSNNLRRYTPYNDTQWSLREFCIRSTYTTPRSTRNHANRWKRSSPNDEATELFMDYFFTLKYQLMTDDPDFEQLVERLAEAGCDDASIGIGEPGRIALAFARARNNARDAICTAVRDVRQAIPSARLVGVTPDFVGLTEVA